jgi:hypothetical protein
LRQRNRFTPDQSSRQWIASEIGFDPFAPSGVKGSDGIPALIRLPVEHKSNRGALAIVNPASGFQFQRESF